MKLLKCCVSKIHGKEAMHRPDILKEKEKNVIYLNAR